MLIYVYVYFIYTHTHTHTHTHTTDPDIVGPASIDKHRQTGRQAATLVHTHEYTHTTSGHSCFEARDYSIYSTDHDTCLTLIRF